jgi:3',5'-cyclic AMP phosphodiesterase CpdA
MILAQISDLHITHPGKRLSGRVDTAQFLARAVTQLNALHPAPDAVLITGDLVDGGSAEDYAHLRQLLAPLQMPFYVIAGNHDERENMRHAFSDQAYIPRSGFLHYAIEDYPVRILALDSNVPGSPHGTLDEAQLIWLAARLREEPMKPTLILVHHPPFSTGIAFMDSVRLFEGCEEFAAIVAKHPQVERVLCGHVHRAIETRWHGTLVMTAPATCHQIALLLAPDAREGFTLEPPSYRLHLWDGRQLVTHTAAIGDYPGPFPFD